VYDQPMNRFSFSRRKFLKQASNAGVAGSVAALFGNLAHGLVSESPAQAAPAAGASTAARVYLDTRRTIAPLDRNLFGSFLNTWGVPSIREFMTRDRSYPTPTDSAKTYSTKSACWVFRSFAIPEAILFPATTGSMVLDRNKTGRARSTKPGTPSSRTSSGPMSFLPGVKQSARSHSWG